MSTTRRDIHKKSILKIVNFANKLNEQSEEEEVNVRLDLLHSLWSQFQEEQYVVLDNCAKEERGFQEVEFDTTEDAVIPAIAKLSKFLKECKAKKKDEEASASSSSSSSQDSGTNKGSSGGLRVPHFKIPLFTGNYEEWPSFRDMFTTLIHENEKMKAPQKLGFLKSNLDGEALKLVNNLALTEANYKDAWKIIQERYNNERILVHKLLYSIHALPPSKGNAEDIRHLLDATTEAIRGLKNLKRPTDQWDDWFVFLVELKLDENTKLRWEETIGAQPNGEDSKVQRWSALEGFLKARFRSLEVGQPATEKSKPSSKPSNASGKAKGCPQCSKDHRLASCFDFKKRSLTQRQQLVRQRRLCDNCLNEGHYASNCQNQYTCRICQGRHHTLLHPEASPVSNPSSTTQVVKSSSHHIRAFHPNKELIATALVVLKSTKGKLITMRALVDPCSHLSFVTQKAVRQILVEMHNIDLSYTTVGDLESSGKSLATVPFRSRFGNEQVYEVYAVVVQAITGQLPPTEFKLESENPLHKLQLADPKFNVPGDIDLLLGIGVFAEIVENGLLKYGKLVAQKTKLGWLLSGTQTNVNKAVETVNSPVFHCKVNLEEQLKAFWELEEMVNEERRLSVEDQVCESHFEETYRKLEDGKFEVQLPFKKLFCESLKLGYTRNIAISSYLRLEKRFSKDVKLRRDYQQVINELLAMKHLEEVPASEIAVDPAHSYYLPHHPVVNEESSTTKLRVVFNASQKSSTGFSLNDVTMTGPSLQNDLLDILLHIRLFMVAFTADVAKMYRQIWVSIMHRDFQRLVWRNAPHEPIKDYRLCTVTYGTSSATYLALKVVGTIVKEAREVYPLAAEIASSYMYMDNIFAGAHDLSTALLAKEQLERLFAMAKFELRKWASNSSQFLETIPTNLWEAPINFNGKGFIKTLGSYWDPIEDEFRYRIKLGEPPIKVTKRKMLSEASGLFDPLGLVSPSVVIAKIQLQELWKVELGWDDTLPEYLSRKWLELRSNLVGLEKIKIPRWLGNCTTEISTELHGFSDATKKAYAAAVCVRVLLSDASVRVTLLMSKTKVAPIQPLTINRLELCGALLLSRVLKRAQTTMKYDESKTFAWSDSMTVLHWLRSDPSRWKSFVANRTSEISSNLPEVPWNYVNTKENPADHASRGLMPSRLISNELWWSGPKWLTANKLPWLSVQTEIELDPNIDLEERKVVSLAVAVTVQWELRTKYSSWLRLLRVSAWIRRFVNNCRNKSVKNKSKFLKPVELNEARLLWIKVTQRLHFSNEIVCLENLDELPRKSSLRSLAPQLDQDGVLRLGGRLRRSKRLTAAQKHPIILPSRDHFTELLLGYAHEQTMHGNVQIMRAYLRQNYWILKDRATIRHFVRRCEVCFKYIAKPAHQLMADLPRPRIDPDPARAFVCSGVDYAGPIKVKMQKKNWSFVLSEGYIAVFVCMATKAIHLEGVMDQTTSSFIAAYHRMKARRGPVSHMYSDNGGNFVGAARILAEDWAVAIQENEEFWAAELANEGVEWHFNPPRAPHHGGLFEAGVKSMKYHLQRILQNHNLTYEELTTVLCQEEAVLNSRPICPLSEDPSDDDVLTPGHFLVGTSLLATPEPNLLTVKENRLSRWQQVQQLHQRLWKLWSSDYLSQLQQRGKWQQEMPNLKVGELVLVIEDNMPPGKWLRARVVEVHPDSHGLGLVRQATIRCKGNTYLRPITKLCPLPCNKEESIGGEEIPGGIQSRS